MPQSPLPTPLLQTKNMVLEGIEKFKIGNETVWKQTQKQ